MQDTLEIRLLGGVALQRQSSLDQPADPAATGAPGASRALGLLAYLVVHADVPQPRPHLAATFWPDSTEAQARTNLRRELHQLKALLDNDASLRADATTLGWRDTDGCRVDVRRFRVERRRALEAERSRDLAALARHSAAAIEWYGGQLLPGWYDEWVLDERGVLLQQCVELLDKAVGAARELRDHSTAMTYARRRIQLAPLEESGYRRLMALQAEAGDRAGAMTTYHRCASVLEQELNVGPSRATMQAMQAVMGGSAHTAGRRGSPGDVATAESAVGPALVGREPELAALVGCWESARAGAPGMALVMGQAGVGKSRLVAELSTLVTRQGAVVASARCFGTSERLALAPVADWLRSPHLRAAKPALDRVWRDEVDRLVPSGSTADAPAGSSRAKVDAWQRLRFFEGLARAVLVVRRPVLLVLDDLQWCDDDTLLWLSFLLELAADAPLLIAATARGEELQDNHEALSVLTSLRSAGRVSEIALGPLTPADTSRVAAQMLGRPLSEDDAFLLQSATGGYPLYVVEAVRNLRTSPAAADIGAESLSLVLQQRLASASEPARQVAGLAAAVGRDFSLELLIEASDQDSDSVVRAVDELWSRRILHQSALGYDFSHDLLRETAYQAVAPAQRWLHHRRLAQAIEILHSGRLDSVAAQLAHHYASSGRADRAVPFYAAAAEAAATVFANAEAIRLLRMGLDLLATTPPGRDRDLRELELLDAISPPLNALHGYASPELEATLTRSVDLAEALGETRVHLASLVGLWAARIVQGHLSDSHRLATRALELSEQVPELAGQAHFAIAGSSCNMGALATAVVHFELARSLSVGAVSLTVGSRPEVHAQAWCAHARWLLGDDEGAARDCREAVSRAREVQHPYSLAVALAYAAITYQMRRELPMLDATLEELAELCARYDLAYYREWALILSGWRSGGGTGIARMRRGLAHLSADHELVRMPYWLSLLAETHRADGDDAACRAALDAGVVAAVQSDERWWLPELLRQSASLQTPELGEQTLRRAAAMAARHSSTALVARCRADLGRLVAPDLPSSVRDVPRDGERPANG